MFKLLVNLPQRLVGSIVTAEIIGRARLQELIDAGMVEAIADPALSPLEQALELIAEARGFFAGFADRLKVVVVQAASLENDDRMAVAVELRDLLLEQEPEEPGALAELLKLAMPAEDPEAAKVEGGPPPETSGGQGGVDAAADQAAAGAEASPPGAQGDAADPPAAPPEASPPPPPAPDPQPAKGKRARA